MGGAASTDGEGWHVRNLDRVYETFDADPDGPTAAAVVSFAVALAASAIRGGLPLPRVVAVLGPPDKDVRPRC
ncbi:hypothetical protein [Halosegnis marinus]|uniref:Uncharacterized protein n=1 Tax=Halosegnis marinus TaxID=3034023 RepID=A0ABD5ZQ97_9EURY|nr:hypothetical protein [Halosegnis sp. DT85]